jgi:SAM-dependent methyltransferase
VEYSDVDPHTGEYYDRLSAWTRVAQRVGYGGGHATQTVHRALIDPRAAGRPTATRLHDLLLETLPPFTSPRVLDAGCGMGGTMIDLASRVGGQYLGVTLSERQARIGRDAVVRAGLAGRVQLLVRSYDTPPVGPFDLIIAIESLAHSPNPAASVTGLARRLTPGGLMAIVDDMPRADIATNAVAARDLGRFKRGWRCPVLATAAQHRSSFEACGLDLIADRDLTSSVVPRTRARIALLGGLNRAAATIFAFHAGWRSVLDSYYGGLALERLYRGGFMDYRMLVAQRASAG